MSTTTSVYAYDAVKIYTNKPQKIKRGEGDAPIVDPPLSYHAAETLYTCT